MSRSSVAKVRRLLASLEDGAELDADEQAELALKIRYGIGAGQIDELAASGADVAPPVVRRDCVRAQAVRAPAPTPGSEEAQRAAVARLGRGHGMGRRWGGW